MAFRPIIILSVIFEFSPRLNKGKVVATPLTVFPARSKTLKKVIGHLSNLLYSFAVILMKKSWGTTLPGGRVSRQVRG